MKMVCMSINLHWSPKDGGAPEPNGRIKWGHDPGWSSVLQQQHLSEKARA